jgi:hypothetical protein
MSLSEAGIVRYMLDQGLLRRSDIAAGHLLVVPASRQHRNFLVRSGEAETGWFVKQPGANGPMEHAGISREAAFYWLVSTRDPFRAMGDLVPSYVQYDPLRPILVLDAARGTPPHRRQSLDKGFPPAIGEAVGRALAAVHQIAREDAGEAATLIPEEPPWVLAILQASVQGGLPRNPGTEFALGVVRHHPGFERALAKLREGWQPQRLTHGDMKWDNTLVDVSEEPVLGTAPAEEGVKPPAVRLLDWEMAAWGDPAWDVGSLIQDYVSQSMLASSLPPQAPPDAVSAAAETAMAAVRPAVAAFWAAYGGAGINPDFLRRSIGYAGSRMLQTCIETLAVSGVVTPNLAALLQLSHHILERPDAAAVSLLGFR